MPGVSWRLGLPSRVAGQYWEGLTMTTAAWRRAATAILFASLAGSLLLWIASSLRPMNVSVAGLQVGARNGRIHLVRASAPVQGDGNIWRTTGGAAVLIGPQSAWRPSTGSAAISVNGLTTSFQGLYVPFPFLTAVLAAALLATRWLRPRRAPHACRGCGYDLTGCPSARCPECGRPRPGRALRTWFLCIQRLRGGPVLVGASSRR